VDAEAITEREALVLAGPPLESAPGPVGLLLPEAVSPLASAPQIAAASEFPPVSAAPLAATPAPPATSLPAPSESPAPQVAALPLATAPAGPYVVQLAALKSQDGPRPAWGRLQKAHSALLSERELATQEIDLGERGVFYRVQAGYFPDRASALELCNALKARGQDCFVVER
jgi:cell division septation protein DedD